MIFVHILAGDKSVMTLLVKLDALQLLLDGIGSQGVNVMLTFETEKDIETAIKIADQYR